MCVDPVRIQIEFWVVPCFKDVLITAWNEKAIMAYTHRHTQRNGRGKKSLSVYNIH